MGVIGTHSTYPCMPSLTTIVTLVVRRAPVPAGLHSLGDLAMCSPSLAHDSARERFVRPDGAWPLNSLLTPLGSPGGHAPTTLRGTARHPCECVTRYRGPFAAAGAPVPAPASGGRRRRRRRQSSAAIQSSTAISAQSNLEGKLDTARKGCATTICKLNSVRGLQRSQSPAPDCRRRWPHRRRP